MKYLSWVSLLIGIVVVVNEISFIGKSSLAWVVIGLAASVILLAVNQISVKKA
jgi:uncharacterized membrane protein